VHGWNGSPHNHWFPWLKRELAENGCAVFAPRMPGGEHPKLSEWLAHLNRVVVESDADTYFVGHSLGCIATVKFLETLSEGVQVGGCVFVGGFSGDLETPEIVEFYKSALDIEEVRRHCKKFISIASDNDTVVPLAFSKEFNEQLGGELIVEKKRGHFCKDDGVTELLSALTAVLELAGLKALSPKL